MLGITVQRSERHRQEILYSPRGKATKFAKWRDRTRLKQTQSFSNGASNTHDFMQLPKDIKMLLNQDLNNVMQPNLASQRSQKLQNLLDAKRDQIKSYDLPSDSCGANNVRTSLKTKKLFKAYLNKEMVESNKPTASSSNKI